MNLEYLSIEPTNRCNLDCEWCARRIMTRPTVDMSMDTVVSVIAQIPRMEDLKYVVIGGWGEPTLHPKIERITELFAQSVDRLVFATNATRYIPSLTSLGVEELILHVNEVEGERAENAIKYIKNPGEVELMYVLIVVTPKDQDKVEAFVDKFRPYTNENVKIFLKYPIISSCDNYVAVRDDLESFKDTFILVAGEPYMPRSKYCGGRTEFNTAQVLSDGTLVYECCDPDPILSIGHVNDGILEIFDKSVEKVLPVCRSCV